MSYYYQGDIIMAPAIWFFAQQLKHQSSALLALYDGNRPRVPFTKGQLRGKCFHGMTPSWLNGGVNKTMAIRYYPTIFITQWRITWGLFSNIASLTARYGFKSCFQFSIDGLHICDHCNYEPIRPYFLEFNTYIPVILLGPEKFGTFWQYHDWW